MAYDPTIPVNGTLIDAPEILENFLEGPHLILHEFEIEGETGELYDLSINPDGKNSEVIVAFWKDWVGTPNGSGPGELKFDATSFTFNRHVVSLGNVTGLTLRTQTSAYINSDYGGGDEDAIIYFNNQTQDMRYDYGNSEFHFSENIQTDGGQIYIGPRSMAAAAGYTYLYFAPSAGTSPNPAGGFRYDYANTKLQFSNNYITWNDIGTPGAMGDIDAVLVVGNTAYTRSVFIGTIHSMQAAADSYIKLNSGTVAQDPEIEFYQDVGPATGNMIFDGSVPQFILDQQLSLIDVSENYQEFLCKNINIRDSISQVASTNTITFGLPIQANYIEVSSSFVLNTMTLKSLEIIGEVAVSPIGSITSTGHLKAQDSIYVNSDYAAGDEDATIYFNAGNETLRYDCFDDGLYISPPLFRIGSGAAEDIEIVFFDNRIPTSIKWDTTNVYLEINKTIYASEATNAILVADDTYVFTPEGATTSGCYFDVSGTNIDFRSLGNTGFQINMAAGPYGTFSPRTYTQVDEPTVGQCPPTYACFWIDFDDSKLYLCYNQAGTVKTVELT